MNFSLNVIEVYFQNPAQKCANVLRSIEVLTCTIFVMYSNPSITLKAQGFLLLAISMTVSRIPSIGIGSPLPFRIESKPLGLRGGRLPPYNSEKCFVPNTDAAARVSTRQRVCFLLILTSTVRYLGLRSLIELAASFF